MLNQEQNQAQFNFDDSKDWTEYDWAKLREWLLGLLSNQEITVVFFKKDGTERTMRCTRSTRLIPAITESQTEVKRKESTTTIAVYDLEAAGWRSFTVKNIIKVTV
jgi:hypothetical protein